MSKKTMGIRLAIREEGLWINAYISTVDSMKGALLMASLSKSIAEKGDFFERWKAIMVDVMARGIEAVTGAPPDDMIEQPAPLHEKAGTA